MLSFLPSWFPRPIRRLKSRIQDRIRQSLQERILAWLRHQLGWIQLAAALATLATAAAAMFRWRRRRRRRRQDRPDAGKPAESAGSEDD